MRVLLVSGPGPVIKNHQYLAGSLLDPADEAAAAWYDRVWPGLRLDRLVHREDGRTRPLLRPRRYGVPHLTTFTLQAVLDRTGVEHDWLGTDRIWADDGPRDAGDYDVVLLSTTFIWEWASLVRAVRWLAARWPTATLVLGGQYSNLKYARILRRLPEVDHVVRGDGEAALPALLAALAGDRDGLVAVPNLVGRDDAGRPRTTPLGYVDLEAEPSPAFDAQHPIVPYESMRGCPYTCGFCSFPHASPRWRHKSAVKIRDDWARYAKDNGAVLVKAMDSTFTIPPTRMRQLFEILPALDLGWEAYSRANTIKDREYVERLLESHCRSLSIGFESMSARTLENMHKKVTVAANRRAHEVLAASELGYRSSFMCGYPGETPEDYQLTHDFVVNEFEGYYIMSVFSLQDETMPVWQEADRFGLVVSDPEDYDYAWSHSGMDEPTARRLLEQTLDQARRSNERAVLMHWQAIYEHPFLPHRSRATNLRVEKAIERLAMVHRDTADERAATGLVAGQLAALEREGVVLAPAAG